MSIRIIQGDCREVLASLPNQSAQCCVTSPPYYGLRDYGVEGQIGLEQTPAEYVAELVAVFREVRRALRDDGTVWLNLGDSYHNYRSHMNGGAPTNTVHRGGSRDGTEGFGRTNRNAHLPGLKDKDLIGIPWRVAFALQEDGWWLRSDIIWAKPNPMPESVTDRPTRAHEYLFLLTKAGRYFFDAEAVRESSVEPDRMRADRFGGASWEGRQQHSEGALFTGGTTRNIRSVWTIATQPFTEAHFATFPPELAERCIRAGSRKGDTVLDPFAGAGTSLLVADRLGRDAIGIELNADYAAMAERRIRADAGLFAQVAAQ